MSLTHSVIVCVSHFQAAFHWVNTSYLIITLTDVKGLFPNNYQIDVQWKGTIVHLISPSIIKLLKSV